MCLKPLSHPTEAAVAPNAKFAMAFAGGEFAPATCFWRRERDSNPRYRFKPVRRFSKPLVSATHPSLRLAYADCHKELRGDSISLRYNPCHVPAFHRHTVLRDHPRTGAAARILA